MLIERIDDSKKSLANSQITWEPVRRDNRLDLACQDTKHFVLFVEGIFILDERARIPIQLVVLIIRWLFQAMFCKYSPGVIANHPRLLRQNPIFDSFDNLFLQRLHCLRLQVFLLDDLADFVPKLIPQIPYVIFLHCI